MRISDCSSDVCSSDLGHRPDILGPDQAQPVETLGFGRAAGSRFGGHGRTLPCSAVHAAMDGGGRVWRGRPAARGRFPLRVSLETGLRVFESGLTVSGFMWTPQLLLASFAPTTQS